MTIWKMFTVGIKNCIRNWKVTLLFGVLVTLGLCLIFSIPFALLEFALLTERYDFLILTPFVWIVILISSVLQPVLTTLPLLIAYTRPPQFGPQDFKGRFKQKFVPFLLLNLIVLGISMALSILSAILLTVFSFIATFLFMAGSTWLIYVSYLLIVTLPFCLFQILVHYSYIALVTEPLKATQALSQGFRMLSKHLGRSVGNYLVFSLMVAVVPGILIFAGYITTFSFLPFGMISTGTITIIMILLISAIPLSFVSGAVLTASMVELYRKNWLEDHPVPGETVSSDSRNTPESDNPPFAPFADQTVPSEEPENSAPETDESTPQENSEQDSSVL